MSASFFAVTRCQSLFPVLLLLCFVIHLTACARPPLTSGDPAAPGVADALWNHYLDVSKGHESLVAVHRSYRLQLSLRYGTEGDTRRVTALLWANDQNRLRMDVAAGVGVTVANILDDGSYFVVYAPHEGRAYYHHGRQKPLLQAGVPMPFGVGDLAALLHGRFTRIFGAQTTGQALQRPGGGILFPLADSRVPGTLEMDARGLPVAWRDLQPGGWTLQISYDDAEQPLPYKLEISHGTGQRAIMLVKAREYLPLPFTDAQLSLILPEGTPVLPITQFRQASP